MQKIWYVTLLLILPLLVFTQTVEAKTVLRSGQSISIADNQKVEGNFYVFGDSVSLLGPVEGDLVVLGGTVNLNGSVTGDVLVLGGNVTINGEVGDDVRAVAGSVTIAGKVGGDVAAAVGKIDILSTAEIDGDILAYSSSLTLAGRLGGKLMGNIGTARLDGGVSGDVEVTTNVLELGKNAKIQGEITYKSDVELIRAPEAEVAGDILRNDRVSEVAGRGVRSLTPLLLLLFATLSLYLVFKTPLERVVATTRTNFNKALLVGFLALFLVPIAIAVLLVSLLGSVIGVMLLLVYILLVLVAILTMSLTVGELISLAVYKDSHLNVWWILLGALIIAVVGGVHLLGFLGVVVIFLATLGGMLLNLNNFIRETLTR